MSIKKIMLVKNSSAYSKFYVMEDYYKSVTDFSKP